MELSMRDYMRAALDARRDPEALDDDRLLAAYNTTLPPEVAPQTWAARMEGKTTPEPEAVEPAGPSEAEMREANENFIQMVKGGEFGPALKINDVEAERKRAEHHEDVYGERVALP